MIRITCVLTNNGDGSNSIEWVTDQTVLDKMQELADKGDESYASGDGLQTTVLSFPDDFDLETWLKTNRIEVTTLEKLMEWR